MVGAKGILTPIATPHASNSDYCESDSALVLDVSAWTTPSPVYDLSPREMVSDKPVKYEKTSESSYRRTSEQQLDNVQCPQKSRSKSAAKMQSTATSSKKRKLSELRSDPDSRAPGRPRSRIQDKKKFVGQQPSASTTSSSNKACNLTYGPGGSRPCVADSMNKRSPAIGFCDKNTHSKGFIHAIDIGSSASQVFDSPFEFELVLPRALERFNAASNFSKDDTAFDPIDQMVKSVQLWQIATKKNEGERYEDLESRLQMINRSLNSRNERMFAKQLSKLNDCLSSLRPSVSWQQSPAGGLDSSITHELLLMSYTRVISPRATELSHLSKRNSKRRQEGLSGYNTSCTYGELTPPMLTRLFAETGLQSGDQFVDLGSGVGNAVLQASIETGAVAFGVELTTDAASLADEICADLIARCDAWDIPQPDVTLVQGDMLTDCRVRKVLRKAAVVLSSNKVFSPALNHKMMELCADTLQPGARMVTLEEFIPTSQLSVLRFALERREYPRGSTSWADCAGPYYIYTRLTPLP